MADLNTIKGSGRWLDAVPSDSADLSEVPRAIYIGVTGDVKMTDGRGNTSTFKAMPVGLYALHPRRIYSTLTTATNIVLLY